MEWIEGVALVEHSSIKTTCSHGRDALHAVRQSADTIARLPLVGVFDALVRATTDLFHVIDFSGSVVWANASGMDVVGQRTGDDSGTSWQQSWPGFENEASTAFREALAYGEARFEANTPAQDVGRRCWDVALTRINLAGALPMVVATARETRSRDARAERLLDGDVSDWLTGLPNRIAFHQELAEAIADARLHNTALALITIDLDGFKELNNQIGGQPADSVLAEFANVMRECAGESAFLARSGGDEFALVVRDAGPADDLVAHVQARMDQCIAHIVRRLNYAPFSASAGVAVFPIDAASDRMLLRNAHAALRKAKLVGRGRCLRFDGGMRQEIQRQSSMLDVARAAMSGDWIRPYYQPKIDLASGKVVGFEALLRWHSPGGALHQPDSIAAAFNDATLAVQISQLMLQKVIADMKSWCRIGRALPVAINASAADLQRTDFAARFLRQIEEAELPSHLFELEVTEGVFLGVGGGTVGASLRTLNQAGVRIALDDFGTGFASLSHLKQHPVDVIKIDRSFVRDLQASPDDCAIIAAMAGLGRNLAIEVVAEGIESEGQVALLRDMGCHTGQGYLFAPAIEAAQVPKLPCYYPVPGDRAKRVTRSRAL